MGVVAVWLRVGIGGVNAGERDGLGVGIGGVNAGERDGLRVGLLDAGRGCAFLRCCPVGKEAISIVEIGVGVLYATLLRVCILGEGEEPGLRVG